MQNFLDNMLDLFAFHSDEHLGCVYSLCEQWNVGIRELILICTTGVVRQHAKFPHQKLGLWDDPR